MAKQQPARALRRSWRRTYPAGGTIPARRSMETRSTHATVPDVLARGALTGCIAAVAAGAIDAVCGLGAGGAVRAGVSRAAAVRRVLRRSRTACWVRSPVWCRGACSPACAATRLGDAAAVRVAAHARHGARAIAATRSSAWRSRSRWCRRSRRRSTSCTARRCRSCMASHAKNLAVLVVIVAALAALGAVVAGRVRAGAADRGGAAAPIAARCRPVASPVGAARRRRGVVGGDRARACGRGAPGTPSRCCTCAVRSSRRALALAAGAIRPRARARSRGSRARAIVVAAWAVVVAAVLVLVAGGSAR